MTDALVPLVNSLGFDTTHFEFFTAPDGVPSINNEEDAAKSAQACLPVLTTQLKNYDAFLVCCYSHHPLVSQLRQALEEEEEEKEGNPLLPKNKPVTGIFEASIATCIQSINMSHKFGIVSTGSQWEQILSEAVSTILGSSDSSNETSSPYSTTRYAGCQTTGLNADELHTTPPAEVRLRMKNATKKLLRNGNAGGGGAVKAIALGCAGMAGMDAIVREACVEELGEREGRGVKIVDGVVAGVVFLEGALRSGL
ncbi:uncharacterized protein SEPMUDRAFT_146404 [Sphaerulina musiva SO2202]|uniref:Hydantoin racemase n=1 Tax=Sphaerulina musiva (strain SO2202) TaxID=692275 RepID=N1QM60_SPHMS|nr:uncharacterized protein SEPMUDRAFT_146404 [Sphaerulina musiva SO2202]EMF17362.1 hypothetical protein SEPMUDRAFT_146404 [Sphaerulina musiva SO2202]